MSRYADPKALGLGSRVTVEVIDVSTYAIVMNRKSRIIMADGKKILANAEKIKQSKPGTRIMLKTTAPVCSKTLTFLADHGIETINF
jgi:hypothetical protein